MKKIFIAVIATINIVAAGGLIYNQDVPTYAFIAVFASIILWWGSRKFTFTFKEVLVVAILLRIVFILIPPSLSDDMYRYVWDGQVQHAGGNPYLSLPTDEIWQDNATEWQFDRLNSKQYYSVYPPVSQMIFYAGGTGAIINWNVAWWLTKIIFFLLELAGLFFLMKAIYNKKPNPDVTLGLGQAGIILYAWNPLILAELIGQAHTEAAMIGFLGFTIWFLHQKKPLWATAMLTLAGWVKLFPLVALPLMYRRGGWKTIPVAGVISLLVWMPYFSAGVLDNMRSSVELYVSLFEFNAGIYYAIKEVCWMIYDMDLGKTIGPILRMVFLGSLPIIYLFDYIKKWTFSLSIFVIFVLWICLATTVHPWYFAGVLFIAPLFKKVPDAIYWSATISILTYLFYSDLPFWGSDQFYWFVVILGWGSSGIIFNIQSAPIALQWLQLSRGKAKISRMKNGLPADMTGETLLDLGAGEGYVGQAFADQLNATVTLADVVDFNQTDLPHVQYDGHRLPFDDNHFDYTALVFVLHHCENQEEVFQEALRVTKKKIFILESVYQTEYDLKQLTFLDTLANRVRSGGLMTAQEEFLHFRRVDEWLIFFKSKGVTVEYVERRGKYLHQQGYFVVIPPADDING